MTCFGSFVASRRFQERNIALVVHHTTDISPSHARRLVVPLTDALGRPVGPSQVDAPQPLLRDESAYGHFFEFPAFNTRCGTARCCLLRAEVPCRWDRLKHDQGLV